MGVDEVLEELSVRVNALERSVESLRRNAKGKKVVSADELAVACRGYLNNTRKNGETRTASEWFKWAEVRGFQFRYVAEWLDKHDPGWRERGEVKARMPPGDKSKSTEFTIGMEALHGGNGGQPTAHDADPGEARPGPP